MNTKSKPEEATSLLRVPKAKNKLGLKIPKIAMPHDDLIFAEKPILQIVLEKDKSEGEPSMSSQTRQSSMGSQTRQSHITRHTDNQGEIAPTKNYQKVPNSITKQAIPDGFFKGKDKHLYDVLYSLTRGAIEPKRSIRINKIKLMKLASIGSRITFDSCVERLQVIGLLNLKIFTGEHEGNEFEILLPEEINTLPSVSSLPSQSSQTSPAQKLDRLLTLETSQTSHSLNSIDVANYSVPKTSFKDNTKTDDESARINEGLSVMGKRLDEAAKKITGKGISKNEAEKWGTLADLLILELETAAKRADSISSAPAFLTEVLRRKLMNGGGRSNVPKPGMAQPDVVGKNCATGEYEIKPLDKEGRESALEQLREWADDDEFLQSYKRWYVEEDWEWLIKELREGDEIEKDENKRK